MAGGMMWVVVPEVDVEPDKVAADVRAAYERGKAHAIVVVAEGARHDGEALVRYFREHRGRFGFEPRLTVLGHVQRGGRPGATDRLLATRLGAAAVEHLARGEHGVLVGMIDNRIKATPLGDIIGKTKTIDRDLLDLARTLAQ